MSPSRAARPTNLHVAHDDGGGAGAWIEDFAAADPFSRNLALCSFGSPECRGIGLRLLDAGNGAVLASWVLADPVSELRARHREHAAIVRRVCERFDVRHLYVSSLLGHSFDVYDLGLPVTHVHHDYSPYCPALHATRQQPCTSCTAADLEACREVPWGPRPRGSWHFYRGLRDAFFAAQRTARVSHVAPSGIVARTLRRLDPRFEDIAFEVVEPGLPYRRSDCFGGAEGPRLRVGLLGGLAGHSGLDLLRLQLATWSVSCDVFLVGAGDEGAAFASRWGVHFIHHYSRQGLPELIAGLRLDLVLLLHAVPEPFSRALSLAWCFCLPPAAHRLGAPEDEIVEDDTGFLLDLHDGAVLDLLLRADRDREMLRRVATRLRSRPTRTVEEEVAAYYRLRGDVVELAEGRLRAAAPARREVMVAPA